MRRLYTLIAAVAVAPLLGFAGPAQADPVELGCGRDIVVRVNGVACAGVDYPWGPTGG